MRPAPARLSSTPSSMSISASASAPACADARRRLLGALGVAGEDPARAAGLHDHQADAVRDDVVHLARDPAALVGDRLLRLALAPLGGERGRLVQLGGVLQRAGPDGAPAEPAERDEDRREVDVCRPWRSRSSSPTTTTAISSSASTMRPSRDARVARRRRRRSSAAGRTSRPARTRRRPTASSGTASAISAIVTATGWVRRHSSSQAHRPRRQRDHPARPLDAVGEQRLGHRRDADRGGQRDVDRPRCGSHATRSSGSRARTA